MSFNSNTWYSIENFGNDFFLACQNVGNCGTGEDDLANAELFQIAAVNGSQPYYIRPKAINADASGNAYCVNLNSGQPAIAPCSSASAIWGIQNWNSQSSGDGYYFFSSAVGDSQRLYLSDNETYSLYTYSASISATQKNLMQWGVSSRGAINDQTYSTVPAAISSGTIVTSTTTSNSTTTATSSGSTLTSSTASVTSKSGSSASTSSVAPPSPSTSVVFVTPTVTASQPASTGGSRTSTSSATPTLQNGAHRLGLDPKATLALMVVFPSLLRWLA